MLQQIKQQIDRLRALGADYADARWVPVEEHNNLVMWNGNLKQATLDRESGIGIRVLYKGAWGFSAASDLSDLAGGLIKTFVFATLIAGIGCLRGLQTGTGPSAVGDSATRSVVSGIVAIVVADGIFAVLYYFLGI